MWKKIVFYLNNKEKNLELIFCPLFLLPAEVCACSSTFAGRGPRIFFPRGVAALTLTLTLLLFVFIKYLLFIYIFIIYYYLFYNFFFGIIYFPFVFCFVNFFSCLFVSINSVVLYFFFYF